MRNKGGARFHKLLGPHKARINYAKSDFADYVLMIVCCAALIGATFGAGSFLTPVGIGLCVFMVVSFAIRHGVAWKMPLLLRRPQELLFVIAHKVENLPLVYWLALLLALVENVAISWTPQLPHHVELMRQIGFGLFYLHLAALFAYRTYSLLDHWRKHAIVSKVLLDSPLKNVGLVRKNIRYEIVHAYITGLLTHLILVIPWYLAITHLQFSVVFAPIVCAANVVLQLRFLRKINAWFYRDHWLGHNKEFEFIYLHGSHHDAIPVGLIAVAGNGFLEGFFRNILGYPTPFFNPIIGFLFYTDLVKRDIDLHQFIPKIFPELQLQIRRVNQHSTHHFGHLAPYGFAVKIDQPGVSDRMIKAFSRFPDEIINSAKLDEELSGFEWDNARHEWFIKMCEEYE